MRRLLALAAALALCLAAPAGAQAAFGLAEFDVTFQREDGTTATQAGSHPYSTTVSVAMNTKEGEGGEPVPDEALKDLYTFMIPGFIGDLTAVPACTNLDFLAHPVPTDLTIPGCSDASAVGKVLVEVGEVGTIAPLYAPVYLLEAPPGDAAKLGFWVQNVPVTIDLNVSEAAPHQVIARLRNVSQILEFYAGQFTIWGVPASPAHDEERGRCYEGEAGGPADPKCPAGIDEAPFLTLPRSCTGPLTSSYEADPWQHPGLFVTGSALTHDEEGHPQGMSGCGALEFAPGFKATPSTSAGESPAGLEVSIDVADEGLKSPTGLAQADISAILAALPEGVELNPSAAEGLASCSPAQLGAEALAPGPGGCPEASKLGTVEAETPILGKTTIKGSLYLGPQEGGAGEGFAAALYLVLREPQLGILIKQAGTVEVEEPSGQVFTSFEDLPPFPLSHVRLHLHAGPRAALITPPGCATYTTEAFLTPSSGAPPLPVPSSFAVTSGPGGGPCPSGIPPFSPGFEAGSANNGAGAFSAFAMRLTRKDGEQGLTRFSAALPRGVVGKIAGVGRCPDAAIAAAKAASGRGELAAPSCPASSQVGHLLAGAGVGGELTWVPGSLYLAGPFAGDPLSIAAIVPAVAGPFDLGTVVTRVGLNLNPTTAVVEVDGSHSEPIPQQLEGVPLKLRDLRIYTDRPNFTLNPTNCSEEQTTATAFGSGANLLSPADDAPVSLAARYQAAGCGSLPFKPKLSLKLVGGTKRTAHPALRSTLVPRAGDANIATATITLPHSEFIDQDHINNPCTRVQFNEGACPANSVLGTATAYSPLLEEPLTGPVYFRSNGGERKLPDVVVDLHDLFRIILIGEVTSHKERIRTTFRGAPDAPVSRFELSLYGGKRGLLVNSADLCQGRRRHVSIALAGQNGRNLLTNPVMGTGCKGRGK